MIRIISTKIKGRLVSALADDFDIKEFKISEDVDGEVSFNIGDIIVGRVENIVKNINACFVEIFPGIQAYLPLSDEMKIIYANGKPGGRVVVDDLILVQQAKTTQHLLIFTNQANVIYRPIHELPDIRWKDLGEHLSQTITNLSKDEEVLYAEILDDFETGTYLAATKLGQIKRFERKEFTPWRTYKSKSVKYAKLKDDSDFIVTVTPIQLDDIMIITQKGYALRFNADEVPVVGAKAAGVKAINLKDDDTVQAVFVANTQSFYLLTQRASLKRVATADIPQAKRAGRGLQVLRELKTKPHRVFTAGPVFTENAGGEIDLLATPVEETPQTLLVTATTGETAEVDLSLLNLSDRTSNGSFIEGLADKEVFSAKSIER